MLEGLCAQVLSFKIHVVSFKKKKITILGCHAEKTLGNSIKRS